MVKKGKKSNTDWHRARGHVNCLICTEWTNDIALFCSPPAFVGDWREFKRASTHWTCHACFERMAAPVCPFCMAQSNVTRWTPVKVDTYWVLSPVEEQGVAGLEPAVPQDDMGLDEVQD